MATASAAPAYRVKKIPLENVVAQGINDRGDVVGSYQDEDSGHSRAFLLRDGEVKPLTVPGATISSARAITNSGVIAGSYGTNPEDYTGGFLRHAGKMTTFSPPSGVTDVNDAGDVIGTTGMRLPVLYSKGKTIFLTKDQRGQARAINAAGIIVGDVQVPDSNGSTSVRAAIFSRAGKAPRKIPLLPDGFDGFNAATDINGRGDILGYGSYKKGKPSNYTSVGYVFLYHEGIVSVVGGYSPFSTSPVKMNNRHEIIAIRDYNNGTRRAVLRVENKFIPLEDLVVDAPDDISLLDARDINNRGQIVVSGYNSSGGYASYVLTPVATLDITTRSQSTAASHFVIRGRATGQITKIAYRVGKSGRWKSIAGKNKWHFSLALKRGRNLISVYARTAQGNSSIDQVAITRQ